LHPDRKIAAFEAPDRFWWHASKLSGFARGVQMLRAAQRWPLSLHIATAAAVAAVCLFQLPIERDVPGEPFLPFLLAVIAATLAFGSTAGFVGVGLSTILSLLFFEPVGYLAVYHAPDLIKIELYALVASGSVVAFARVGSAFKAASQSADSLKELNERKSILLRELAHGVANNFAAVAAYIRLRSAGVNDAQAKAVLDAAIEQIRMMGSCDAEDLPLGQDQASSLGLIVNELVTNALKHAFPGGRSGSIRVGFVTSKDGHLQLWVEDDGVGFAGRNLRDGGLGQELILGLCEELRGRLEFKTSEKGSSFQFSIPVHTLTPYSDPQAAPLVH
jgi:two-component sensor histidine kinase